MIKHLFQNILVVINASEASIQAAEYGILMAKLYRCNLKAVYVVDTASLNQLTLGKFLLAEESSLFEENLREDGKKYLAYVEKLGKDKNVTVTTELRSGAVWSEVILSADEMNAGLILLGCYDCSNGTDFSSNHDDASSSSKEIMAKANCSVLIVKEKMIDQLYRLA
ncbi:MAG: universal stress protein [Spirochaetaceae bacterium]|nr:universal stress protein [Spirochaetaceae bacterium]